LFISRSVFELTKLIDRNDIDKLNSFLKEDINVCTALLFTDESCE